MSTAPIYLIFFVSGISGLIYQIVWVRSFGNMFGNTVHSSALVTSVFMCGLGLGSWVAGRYSDKRHAADPRGALRAYALVEGAIGGLGWLIALVLPRLEAWSASVSSYQRGAEGWYELSASSHLARYALVVVLLAPITFLMGATLTLLMRHLLSSHLADAGRRTGLLYGFNTLGAACGCLLVDFTLIPSIGLAGTQQIAVAFNLVAGLSAWLFLRSTEAARTAAPSAAVGPAPLPPAARRTLVTVAIALALTGFAGMGMEIVWFRFLTSAIGQLRSVFSLLLAVILGGIWLGSILGGILADRSKRPVLVFAIAQAVFALSVLLAFFTFDTTRIFPSHVAQTYLDLGAAQRPLYEVFLIARPILVLVAIPALCIGGCFPLANAIVQTDEAAIGRKAGVLYLGNTTGAVLGSLAAGFVFLPVLGMKWSVLACVLIGLSSLVLLASNVTADAWTHREELLLAATTAVVMAAIGAWIRLPADFLILRSFRSSAGVEQYLQAPYLEVASEGLLESIVILKVPADEGGKRLYTNGHMMSASAPGPRRYMRAMAHLPLLDLESPESVLVICFGVGNTLHAASLHPTVRRLEIADLSRHVLEHASTFADTNGDVLRDPRVTVFVNDGRQHLRMSAPASFDLVTLEPPPITFAGVASLYSVEFYELAKERLKPGGYVTQWLPIRQLPGPLSASLVRSFVKVFPEAMLVSGAYGELILMGRNGGRIELDPDRIARHLAAAPAVAADMARNDMATPLDLAGMFVANSETLARVAAGAAPVTDDDPAMEYAGVYFVNSLTPPELVQTQGARRWCPSCFDGSRPEFDALDEYLQFTEAMYSDLTFAYIGPVPPVRWRARHLPMSRVTFDETVARSPYLRRLMASFVFADSDFVGP